MVTKTNMTLLDPSTNGRNSRSQESIVHKRILQTEARIKNTRVLSSNLPQPISLVKSRSRKKENEDPQHKAESQELENPHSTQEHKEWPGHHDQSDKLHRGVPTVIIVKEEHDLQGEQANDSQLDCSLVKDKKLELTRPKDGSMSKNSKKVCDSSDVSSMASSRERVTRHRTFVNRARGNCPAADTRVSSLAGDSSLEESKKTEELQMLQENQGTENTMGPTNNKFDDEEYDVFASLSRLKARLEVVRNDRVSSMGHLMNPNVTDKWMDDSLSPSPPALKQVRNPENFLNRLVSKENHYIKTEYQESECKTDDLGIKVQSPLCSHYRAIQKNAEIAANAALAEDPMLHLLYLAKELAEHASQIDIFQRHDEHLTSNSLSRLSLSTVSHPSMIFHNQGSSLTSLDPSMDRLHSHPALTSQTSANSPSVEYLLKKLQAADEECIRLSRTKDALEASLMEANNVHRNMENLVQDLKEELEAARATNKFLSEELNVAKEEIAALSGRNEKLEVELEQTQNRLGDAIVNVSDLQSECASLRQMVDEKDKKADEDMVLFTNQHESIVHALDDARVIRHLMVDVQGKLPQPKSEEISEGENDPARRAQKLRDDWLKEALPRLDAMDMALTTCKLELEVKLQCSDDDDHGKESLDAAKARWSLFKLIR